MSDFSDAIAVLDTIAGIANDVTKTRYNYVLDNKRQELQEEKWEHTQDKDVFSKDWGILKEYQKNITSGMTKESYDNAYDALVEFGSELEHPKLIAMHKNMADSKTQIGQSIDAKDAWQANVEEIYAKYENIQEEFRSNNFSGTDHLAELAKEMRAGVLSNAKFFDTADNTRFDRLGREIENYADAAKYISMYDADSDLTDFDIAMGHQDWELKDPHTNKVVTNEYDQLIKAVDLIKTGNVDDAMMALRRFNIPNRYKSDLNIGLKELTDHRKAVVRTLENNFDDPDATSRPTSRTNINGLRYQAQNLMFKENVKYNRKLNAAGTKQEKELAAGVYKEQLDIIKRSKYREGGLSVNYDYLSYDMYDEDLAIINSGGFNEAKYATWWSSTGASLETYESQTTAKLEGKVVKASDDYRNAITVGGALDNKDLDPGVKDIINSKGANLYPDITSRESAVDGAPRINRYDEAMAGPSRLVSAIFDQFMGGSQGVFWPVGKDNLYEASDMTNMKDENASDKNKVRNRQHSTFRVLNNIFWGGDETMDEVAEQLGSGGFSPTTAGGGGSGKTEKGALDLMQKTRVYYNKMFTNKIISEYTHESQDSAIQEVRFMADAMARERVGAKKGLDVYGYNVHDAVGKKNWINQVYLDLLGTNEQDIKWKEVVRRAYQERELKQSKTNKQGFEQNILKVAYWNEMDTKKTKETLEEFAANDLYLSDPEAWAEEFLVATQDRKQEMLDENVNRLLPMFLR